MNETSAILHVRSSVSGSTLDDVPGTVETVSTLEAVLPEIHALAPDVVVCEQALDGGDSGLDALEAIRDQFSELPVVLVTDDPDGSVAATATRLGVTEYVPTSEVNLSDRVRLLLESDPKPDPAGLAASFETSSSAQDDRELSIRETDPRLGIALEGTKIGVYEWDLDADEVVWDEATADLFGTTPEAFGGTLADFQAYVHPDDLPSLRTAFEATVESGEPFEAEFRAIVDDETRWLYTAGTIRSRGADSTRLVGIASDVTERKEREAAIEATNDSLQKLTELAAAEGLSEEETIERVLELGAERLGLSLGYLSRIEGSEYEVVSVVGDHDVITEGAKTELSNTFCRRIVDGEDMFGIHDVTDVGWENDAAHQISGITCYLGGQVMVDGELFGTLCFADTTPRTDAFSETEQTYVKLLAEWVGRELERRFRNEDLERYEDVIEAVDDGVYALDSEGNFELVNEAMTDLTAYSEADLLGAHTSTIKDDAVVERAESIVRSMIFGDREEEETFDLEIIRADGTTFPAEDHMTLLRDDDGTFEGTAGIIRDITERKQRELELKEAQKRIKQILERIGDAFFAVDDRWEITYWNSRAAELLGRDRQEVLGEDLWEVFSDAVGREFYDAYHRAMETQEVVTFEEYYPPIDRWFRVNAYPSEEGLSVYFHDITEQRQRDQKLSGLLETTRSLMQARTPEAVARTVAEAAEEELGFDLVLVRLFDEETETLVPTAASDELPDRPLYGAHEGFPGKSFQREETIRVDDFDAIEGSYDNRLAKAGMYVPLGDHGVISVAETDREAFDDADVSVAEILASNAAAALDRVEREQNLLRYETVIENVRDMVYVLDDQGQFQLVTEPLASWLGFDRAEILGASPEIVLDEASIVAFEREIRALKSGSEDSSISMETTLETADGRVRPAEIEITLIDDDVFTGTVGVVRDLTELKRTREELRDERDRFSYLFNNLPDAVVETDLDDGEPIVRSVNPAFTEVFGYDESLVEDERINDVVLPPTDEPRTEATRLDDQWREGHTVQKEIRRRTANGFRDFLFRGIPYEREDGRMWGFGIYTDITEQRDRERRLEVLNRVLRHNLRNDLTVVLGIADELSERLEDESLLDLLDRLQRKASEVATLSDRARQIEQSARRHDANQEPVDVPEMVAGLVRTYRSASDGELSLSVPDTEISAADGRFPNIVEEVLGNAFEHAGPAPSIRVDVTATEQTVSISVSDDGPGIPEHEIDVLTGDEPITQLTHGSGLGLWLVIWVTESYGGSVTFTESAAGGASVTIRVPRSDV